MELSRLDDYNEDLTGISLASWYESCNLMSDSFFLTVMLDIRLRFPYVKSG